VDAVGDAEAVARRHHDVLGEAAGDRHAHDADRGAALVLTGHAVPTRAARADALERDAVAGHERPDARADLRHLARNLVPRAHLRHHHLAVPPVEVRSADAAAPDADENVAGTGGGRGRVLDDDGPRTAAERRLHRSHY